MKKGTWLWLGILAGVAIISTVGGLLWFFLRNDAPSHSEDDLPPNLEDIKMMALVKSGHFLMGNDQDADSDNDPEREVHIKAFYIDETPITYEDFDAFVKDGGLPAAYWSYPTYRQPAQPVTGVSWHHAADFCNWRSLKAGLTPVYQKTNATDPWGYPIWQMDTTTNGFRLPTEAEFEYAARGGLEQQDFPWGNDLSPEDANYDTEQGEQSGNWWRLAEVGSQKANDFGLYGMSGNVWQWCQDWYSPTYYQNMPDTMPKGPANGTVKVVRGGSWGSISTEPLMVHHRSFAAPGHYNYDIGFRCVRPVTPDMFPTEEGEEQATEEDADGGNSADQAAVATMNNFYRDPVPLPTIMPVEAGSLEMLERLTRLFQDYYPNSLYFKQDIDEQPRISPQALAELVQDVCISYDVSPIFLTAVMAAESGMGTCSFPRWYNNPMAWDWQNDRMANGAPTYEHTDQYNRRFRTLRDGFEAFCKGIRNRRYFEAAKKDLYEVHLQYMGYEALEWMHTVGKIYRDIGGYQVDASMPAQEIGQLIYLDWDKVKNQPQPRRAFPQDDMQGRFAEYFIVIKEGHSDEGEATLAAASLKQKGFPEAQVVRLEGKFFVSLAQFDHWKAASEAYRGIHELYKGVAVKGR